jgi:transketolase
MKITLQEPQLDRLKEKARWIRKETLTIHKTAPETRIASSLSAVEIFTVLYYGKIVSFEPGNTAWDGRDRLIISKGHGAISLYPVLADLGFFASSELANVCKEGSFLGGIPDCMVPGFETINGSLGHGLGVACGVALALKQKKKKERVYVLMGDGELYEGAVWEAVMFAGAHALDNLILIVDSNKVSMLGYCRDILDLEPLEKKFTAFGWSARAADGHSIEQLYAALLNMKQARTRKPRVLIANTVKGKGVPRLETDPLSHIKNLSPAEIDVLVAELS